MMLKDKLLEQIKEYIDNHQGLKHLNLNRNTESGSLLKANII